MDELLESFGSQALFRLSVDVDGKAQQPVDAGAVNVEASGAACSAAAIAAAAQRHPQLAGEPLRRLQDRAATAAAATITSTDADADGPPAAPLLSFAAATALPIARPGTSQSSEGTSEIPAPASVAADATARGDGAAGGIEAGASSPLQPLPPPPLRMTEEPKTVGRVGAARRARAAAAAAASQAVAQLVELTTGGGGSGGGGGDGGGDEATAAAAAAAAVGLAEARAAVAACVLFRVAMTTTTATKRSQAEATAGGRATESILATALATHRELDALLLSTTDTLEVEVCSSPCPHPSSPLLSVY